MISFPLKFSVGNRSNNNERKGENKGWPPAQKDPEFDLLLCCRHLEILKYFQTGGPRNYVAGPGENKHLLST